MKEIGPDKMEGEVVDMEDETERGWEGEGKELAAMLQLHQHNRQHMRTLQKTILHCMITKRVIILISQSKFIFPELRIDSYARRLTTTPQSKSW
jgi:hypothetical protein